MGDTSGTWADDKKPCQPMTDQNEEGLSQRQLELMQQMLESQLQVEREHMQRIIDQERRSIRQEMVDALTARGLEEQPGLEEPYEEFTGTFQFRNDATSPDDLTVDDDTSPSPGHDANDDIDRHLKCSVSHLSEPQAPLSRAPSPPEDLAFLTGQIDQLMLSP